MNKRKKVLIVGNSAKEYAVVKKFRKCDCDIYAAPGNYALKELIECVDIREDNVQEILEFVLENGIDLTIAVSETAIKNDIAGLFQANDQLIFAPSAQSASFALSRSVGKRFLYKLRIPTPRFAIFDKLQPAVDYLKNAVMPQVIRADENSNSADRLVCNTFITAKTFVEDLFFKDEKKVVLEDFVYGHEFTFYAVTDGYSVLPLTSVANYKFMEDGDGGILTSGIGCYTPDYKISKELEFEIMDSVVQKVLQSLEKKGTPYLGILGAECVLQPDGQFVVLGFKPFLADHDAEAVLNLIEENLLTLFEACAVGSFADDYESIAVSNNSSVSCVLSSRLEGKIINGLEFVESDISNFGIKKNEYFEYETIKGKNLVLTRTAKTLSRARKHLYEDIDVIEFDGKKYRADICEQVDNF